MSQSRATMNAPPAVPAGPAPPEFIVGAATLSKTEWASMEAAMPSEEIATHRMLSFWMKDCAKKMGVKAIPEETESDEEDESGDEGESDGEMSPGAKAREKQRLAQEAADKEFEEKAKKEKNWSQVHLAYIESKSNYRGIMTPLNFTNWIWAEIIRPKLLDAKGEMMDMTEVHNFFLNLIKNTVRFPQTRKKNYLFFDSDKPLRYACRKDSTTCPCYIGGDFNKYRP